MRYLYYTDVCMNKIKMGKYTFLRNKITQIYADDSDLADILLTKNKFVQLKELTEDELKTTEMEILAPETTMVPQICRTAC